MAIFGLEMCNFGRFIFRRGQVGSNRGQIISSNMLDTLFDHVYIKFEPSLDLSRGFTAISVRCVSSSNSDNHGHNI